MKSRLNILAGLLVAAGASAAIVAAPAAFADEYGGGGPNNPLLPGCEVTGAGGGEQGGETTDCASPGNVQIDSTPPQYGMFPWDDEYWAL